MQKERLDYISKAVRSGRFVSLREVSDTFGISVETARRDVAKLTERNVLIKVHGGAMPLRELDCLSLDERMRIQDAEKNLIGQAAAEFVEDGDIIIMDGGSTTSYMVPHLKGKKLRVITNSVSLLERLRGSWPEMDIIITGGYYYPKSELVLGPLAVEGIRNMHADKAFISTAGITAAGVFNSDTLVAELQKAIMEQSSQTILLADTTKFGKTSLVRLCGFEEISTLITVGNVQPDIANAVRQAGTNLVEAHP